MRKLAFQLVIAVLFLTFVPSPASAETLTTDAEAEQSTLSLVNGERRDRGIAALSLDAELSRIARDHSHDMAADGDLYHNDRLPQQAGDDWAMLGENVGYGPDSPTVHDSFMDSAHHRENILERGFTKIGIGAVRDGDTVYITQVFMKPKDGGGGGSNEPSSPAPRPRRTVGSSKPPIRTVEAPVTTASSGVRLVRRPRAARPAPGSDLSIAMLEATAFGSPVVDVTPMWASTPPGDPRYLRAL